MRTADILPLVPGVLHLNHSHYFDSLSRCLDVCSDAGSGSADSQRRKCDTFLAGLHTRVCPRGAAPDQSWTRLRSSFGSVQSKVDLSMSDTPDILFRHTVSNQPRPSRWICPPVRIRMFKSNNLLSQNRCTLCNNVNHKPVYAINNKFQNSVHT